MANEERNQEKNVKNYNYEWQTDEEIAANAHTKMSFHGREETTLADIIGTDDAEVFRQAHKLWLKLKEAFNKEGADYDPALCNSILGSVGSKECREVMRSLWWAALNGDETDCDHRDAARRRRPANGNDPVRKLKEDLI